MYIQKRRTMHSSLTAPLTQYRDHTSFCHQEDIELVKGKAPRLGVRTQVSQGMRLLLRIISRTKFVKLSAQVAKKLVEGIPLGHRLPKTVAIRLPPSLNILAEEAKFEIANLQIEV